MRKSRFTEEPIVTAIKEHAGGTPAQELCRGLGIGAQPLYRWKAKYGGMSVPDAQRLKSLEDENRRLKKLSQRPSVAQSVAKRSASRWNASTRFGHRDDHEHCPTTSGG